MLDKDFTVEKLSHYEMVVPERPLVKESVQVRAYRDYKSFDEMYRLLKKAAGCWDGFVVYARVTPEQPLLDNWEFIPYTKEAHSWTRHLGVVWAVACGASHKTFLERLVTLESYRARFSRGPVLSSEKPLEKDDVFCTEEIVARQRVVSGKLTDTLFNYAPLGEEHFLIIPREHRQDFKDLEEEEFVEAMEGASKIVHHYTSRGYVCYLFHKTGARAGQSVPHWHLHIVAVQPKNELKEKLAMAWRMVAGGAPLAPEQLTQRVKALRQLAWEEP